MRKGKVTKLIADKGFGFIRDAELGDVFLHGSNCENSFDMFNALRVGDAVRYEIEQGERGLIAKSVAFTEPAEPAAVAPAAEPAEPAT